MGLALIMYGREEEAETLIEQMSRDQDPILRCECAVNQQQRILTKGLMLHLFKHDLSHWLRNLLAWYKLTESLST